MRYCFTLGTLLLCTSSVFSQVESDSTGNRQLDEVVVSATRSAQSSLDVAAGVTLLNNRNDFQTRQPRTAPEALMGATGVFVQKTNHGGGSPFVRGLTGNQTLILIDGIRLNNSTFRYGPNQYLNTIDPFMLERVEVLRGSGSVQYGSDALGGTIQLFSNEPAFNEKSQLGGRVILRGATQGMEQSGRAELNYGNRRLAASVGLSVRKFGDLVGGDTIGKQTPSGYDEWAWNGKLKYKVSDNWTLTVAHQSVRQSHVPLYHRVRLENYQLSEFEPQQRQLTYARLAGQTKTKWAKTIVFTTSLQKTLETRLNQRNGSTSLRTETDRVRTWSSTVEVISELADNWSATSGVEIYNDWVNSERFDRATPNSAEVRSRGLYPDGATYLNYALFSLHQYRLNRWLLTAGLRWNGFKIEIPEQTLGNVNVHPSALVGNASLAFQPAEGMSAYIGIHTGFRAPNIDDMGTLGIVDFRYEIPAYDLKPEKSTNVEFGYKIRRNRWAFSSSLFRNVINNLITRVAVPNQKINGYNVYIKENVEKALIYGFEADGEWLISKSIKGYGGVAYCYGQNETKNEPARRIPPLNGRLGLHFQQKGWWARAEIMAAAQQDRLAQGDKDDNRIPKGGTPGWTILNLHAGYSAKYWNVTLIGQNLTNEDYRTHGSGINGVGRSAWLTLGIVF